MAGSNLLSFAPRGKHQGSTHDTHGSFVSITVFFVVLQRSHNTLVKLPYPLTCHRQKRTSCFLSAKGLLFKSRLQPLPASHNHLAPHPRRKWERKTVSFGKETEWNIGNRAASACGGGWTRRDHVNANVSAQMSKETRAESRLRGCDVTSVCVSVVFGFLTPDSGTDLVAHFLKKRKISCSLVSSC